MKCESPKHFSSVATRSMSRTSTESAEDMQWEIRSDSRGHFRDSSPLIHRRRLTHQEEMELREACGFVLQLCKPSIHRSEYNNPRLDLSTIIRYSAGQKRTAAESYQRHPAAASEMTTGRYYQALQILGSDTENQHIAPVQSNTSKRRSNEDQYKVNFAGLDDRRGDGKSTWKSADISALEITALQTKPSWDTFNHASTMPVPISGSEHGLCPFGNPDAVAVDQVPQWMCSRSDERKRPSAADLSQRPSLEEIVKAFKRVESSPHNSGCTVLPRSLRRVHTRVGRNGYSDLFNEIQNKRPPYRSDAIDASEIGFPICDTVVKRLEEIPKVCPEIRPLSGSDTWIEVVEASGIDKKVEPQYEQLKVEPIVAGNLETHRFNASMTPNSERQTTRGTFVGSPYDITTRHSRSPSRRTNTTTGHGHLNLMMGEWLMPHTAEHDHVGEYRTNSQGHHARSDDVCSEQRRGFSKVLPSWMLKRDENKK